MKNKDNLKPFEKGYDKRRSTKGRPRKFISEMKEQGYAISEILDAIQVLISMSLEELQNVRNNPQATALEISISSAIIKSIQKGDLNALETLLTRAFGKPKEKIEQDINITNHVIKLNFGNGDEQNA